MITVIIPAHNEETVIGRSLTALTQDAEADELQIIVVCNGCRDSTAEVARRFGAAVQVIETSIPSKTNALNMGDQAARGFPRVYMDADVELSVDSVRRIRDALETEGVLAAAPSVQNEFRADASWFVRGYYQFWRALPYIQEGMMGAGVYALNREGRRRFEEFPPLIADDGFVRAHYAPGERVEVRTAVSTVWAPAKLWDLVLIKTRSRLGFFQLRQRHPELFRNEAKTKHYRQALKAILRRPNVWPAAIPYVLVTVISRYRAKRQLRTSEAYVWERDNSSRRSNDEARVNSPRHSRATEALGQRK